MNSLRAGLTPVLAIFVSPVVHKGPDQGQAKGAIASVGRAVSTALSSGRGFRR